MPSVFTRIINRELPSKIFLETDDVIVIKPLDPEDLVHLLIIPKADTPNVYLTPDATVVQLVQTAREVADRLGIPDHFRLKFNNGYGQEIDHVHLHFLSNRGADRLVFEEVGS